MKRNISWDTLTALCLAGALTVILVSPSNVTRAGGPSRFSVPQDWSHRHVIYSAPSNLAQAWRLQAEPRYWHQWLRHNAAALRSSNSRPADLIRKERRRHEEDAAFHTDWGMSLLSSGETGPEMFPAKYSFDVSATPSCANDFVVFNTRLNGAAARATIVAFNQLYSTQGSVGGACNQNGPSVMWAYNTGTSEVDTSVVLSLDGTKVAFVATANGGATLRILKWKAGEGTAVNSPATPTTTLTAGQDWTACPSANSCMASIDFGTGAPDTNSAPFYNYSNDTLYVGDNTSRLHKFTGVFSGVPAEVTAGGWPIQVNGTRNLSSPIYDSGSGNIFVGDDQGRLSYVREAGSTVGTCAAGSPPCLGSTNIALGGAIVDAPIVDSAAGRVFVFDGTDSTNHGSVVQTDTALGNSHTVSVGGLVAGDAIHSGAFDNAYLAGSFTTGHLFVCGKDPAANNSPALHRIGFAASGLMNLTSDGSLTLVSANGEGCSPVTELFDGTTDRLFFSVQDNAGQTAAGCTAALGCIMSLDLGGSWPPAAVTHGVPAAGGTSGIIIDNVGSGAQQSSLYFTFQSNSNANIRCNGATGVGCAVKLTQSGLQ